MKKSPYDEIEGILVKWFKEARDSNVPVNGTILREKAQEIADRLGLKDFTASNAWIDRMKKRHNLVYRSLSGESSSVDAATIEEWKKNLPNLTKGYKPKDVFNADETGLFFNLLPDKSYVSKGDSCHGGKMSKLRLTVLLCCYSDGSEKVTPLVVGKSRKPRCFKNVRSFPTNYEANKKAWITKALFEDFLQKLNKKMKFQNRKIILFIDQCSAHPDLQLSNVRVEFFPANCTSKLQPCDLGIIRSFKVFYRKQLVRKAVAELENGNLNDACKLKLSVLEAMHFISAAWRSVTQKCISHCFEESGIVASNEPLTDAGLDRLDSENDNETVSYDFDEYIRENLATCEAERTTAPSVDDVMDFSSADEMNKKKQKHSPFLLSTQH
ncbi:tigger transposable element-derived protein 6 [Parasteatoda tepidariorum]|uniref:tigger transposable element-derived protein 6 n=1 Tax=Parasteatoda tepidariorum TaxID=114398 RepID=UPI001C727104|nr:tigger transposable element-derived protein 6-like [Parasteatoda tepidariorum]